MTYDPFYVGSGHEGDGETKKKKLVSVRRPPICDVTLANLEWSSGDGATRKRSRPDGHSSAHRSPRKKDAPSDIRNAGPNHTLDQNKDGKTREVIRVVEKVINMEPITIMGVAPLVDDRVRYVVNFILEHVKSPYVEVEAKLGTLIEKTQNVRAVDLVPVLCETPISSESNKDTRFESDVGSEIFSKLNTRLNGRVEETASHEHGRIRYLRTREMDVFWPPKIRETKELQKAADGSEYYETIRVESKRRLGDLNVLCPGRRADIRYSASSEEEAKIPPNSTPQFRRIKDRISYKYEYLSVDITCVEMQDSRSGGPKTTFEVEVEIDSSADLYGEVVKFRQGDETSKLFDIAASMVNTVRLLLEH